MPLNRSLRLISLIERHRALVIKNEALYDDDGKPVGPETTDSDDSCTDALSALMAEPCLCLHDVVAKIEHLLDCSIRKRGPICLDLLDDENLGFFDFTGDPEANSPLMVFLRSLSPRASASHTHAHSREEAQSHA